MSIQVIEVGGDQDNLTNYINSVYIRLDMHDPSAIQDGKRIISVINQVVRRKSTSDETKKSLRVLRDELKQKIKHIHVF